jgi:8-oxo-dGTP diphosphatase
MKLAYTLLIGQASPFAEKQADVPQALLDAIRAKPDVKVKVVREDYGLRLPSLLPSLGRGARVVFIGGYVVPATLETRVRTVHERGQKPIIVVDALTYSDFDRAGVHAKIEELSEAGFQLTHIGEVPFLIGLNWNDYYVYTFAKADNTATIAIFFEDGEEILAIKRKHDPDKGKWALPGGFLRCYLETLEGCVVRETKEEVKARPRHQDIRLVDVRSSPRRDSRQHVVDHGYSWFVPNERKAEVLAKIRAGDDAEQVILVETAWLLRQPIAFDHRKIIKRALATKAA